MNLQEFVKQNLSLAEATTEDQELAIAWFWHTHDPDHELRYNNLQQAFKDIGLDSRNLASTWQSLYGASPKKYIAISINNYKLSLPTLLELDQKYAHCKEHQQSIEVKKLLTDLLAATTNQDENVYLDETIICFRNQAFRAATVMAWNLAYDHLCRYILDNVSNSPRGYHFSSGVGTRP